MPQEKRSHIEAEALIGYRLGVVLSLRGRDKGELAAALKRDPSHVSAVLRGRHLPYWEAWQAARYLDVMLERLIGPPTEFDRPFLEQYRRAMKGDEKRPYPPETAPRGERKLSAEILEPTLDLINHLKKRPRP